MTSLDLTCIYRYSKYLHILTVLLVPAVLRLPCDGGGEEADHHGGQPAHAARHQAGPHRVAATRGGRLCHTTRHDAIFDDVRIGYLNTWRIWETFYQAFTDE